MEQKFVKQLKKSLVKQNDRKERISYRQQVAEQPKFVHRQCFSGRSKKEEDLDSFLSNNASQPKKKYVTKRPG